ncbi:MAG: excinuclease ABC subunit UvrA [Thermodesulfovibrionia bacterium]
MSLSDLIIEGARQNNLKDINLALPHNKVIVITGVSGSGKSSLAFDTIFAEGQWRFIESLSTYARLFLEKLDRPDVDAIHNIRPAIALEQRNPVKGSRSTVGTVTEAYDYLRLLYSKIGRPHCPNCGKPLREWSPQSVLRELIEGHNGEKALIIFETDDPPAGLQRKGFHRVLIEGRVMDISSLTTYQSPLSVVLDRLIIRDEPRLYDSIEMAWRHGGRRLRVEIIPDRGERIVLKFYAGLICPDCNVEVSRPQPLLFSFNHPIGACPECKGFGNVLEYSEDYIIPDKDLSIKDGAIEPWSKPSYRWWYRQLLQSAKANGIDINLPYKDLPADIKRLIFEGSKDFYGIDDFFKELEQKRYKMHVRVFLSRYRKAVTCRACNGTRLRPEALIFKINGLNIAELSDMTVSRLLEFFSTLKVSKYEEDISKEILRQIKIKLSFMLRVGLGYLTLNRLSKTLSGGESQRINLSNQLASRLTGTLYVLDEPTIGLHQRDTELIAGVTKELAGIGNTVIAVEHDRTIIKSADWIVELGPGGGERGGRLIFSGWRDDFLKTNSLTARYLKNLESIPVPKLRRRGSGKYLIIRGASGNNLKDIDVRIPLQTMTCITGVSGSGKSTLVRDTIYNALTRFFKIGFEAPLNYKGIEGLEYLKGVKIIDQKPIGKSPRSNPVTYIKAFDHIRQFFAELPQSRSAGYKAGDFSFNTEGGRCKSCKGVGYQRLEMYFFEDLYIRCEECGGKRYKQEILNITCNGKNIHDVLNMTVDEAIEFFRGNRYLVNKLRLMSTVGLGYLKLGQSATTLSGGEAQRLKICSELGVTNRRDYLYILDEPSVGLHPDDIKKLLTVLNDLVYAGNTVLIVEHNLDIIKSADWIIDLGPEGGEDGGYIVAEGTPEEIAKEKRSHTGRYLTEVQK